MPGADYVAAADAVLALLTDLDDDQRTRLSMDLGADPLTAPLSRRSAPSVADVVATAAKVTGYDGGVRAITVDGPAFHNLGASASWELAGAIAAAVAYLRAARRRRHGRAGCVAADQLPLRRRRRPVHDDREAACGAPTLGPGGRGGGGAGRRCGHRARRHVAADDGAARSVGEHAAHHAGGVLPRASAVPTPCWCTRSTWRSPAASPAPHRVSRGASPATPNCCCSRSPTSAGCSTPPADRGSSRTSPSSWPSRRGSTFRTSKPAAGSSRPATTSQARDRRGGRDAGPTTSRTGAPRSPASTSIRISRNRLCRTVIR